MAHRGGLLRTEVVETFDWSTSKAPWFIELSGWPETRIVQRYYLVTAVALAAGLLIRGGA